MAVLRAIAAASVGLAAGCYDPQLQDCVVRCASDGDCGPGQVCNTLNLCAAPNGGTCGANTDVDAALRDGADPLVDAGDEPPPLRDGAFADAAPPPPPDAAPPPPDAPVVIRHNLKVSVMGMGRVDITGVGSCTDDCDFDLAVGTYTLRGEPAPTWHIERWQADCASSGSAEVCTLVLTQPAHARLKLKRD